MQYKVSQIVLDNLLNLQVHVHYTLTCLLHETKDSTSVQLWWWWWY